MLIVLLVLLGLLGLRIFETCGANIADLGEEHGHRVLRVRGKGGQIVLVPLPPAVARAIDQAVDGRTDGPILRNTLGAPDGPPCCHPPAQAPGRHRRALARRRRSAACVRSASSPAGVSPHSAISRALYAAIHKLAAHAISISTAVNKRPRTSW